MTITDHAAFWLNLSLLALGVGYLVTHRLKLDEEENVMVAKIGAMTALCSSVVWLVAAPSLVLTVPSVVAAAVGMIGIAVFVAEEKALARELAEQEGDRS